MTIAFINYLHVLFGRPLLASHLIVLVVFQWGSKKYATIFGVFFTKHLQRPMRSWGDPFKSGHPDAIQRRI